MQRWMLGLGVVVLVGGLAFWAQGVFADGAGEGEGTPTAVDHEVVVPLSEVPAAVLEAARKAKPGLQIRGVERDTEDGVTVYDVEGDVGGTSFELEVTAAGKVVEIEEDDDDDDDDDDDGDDDGDDEGDD